MSCTLRPCSKMNEGEDIGNRFPRSRVCASEKSRFRPRQDCYHESVSRGLVDRSLWTRQDSRSGFSRTNLHNPTATMSDADDDWTLLPDEDVPNTNNNDVSPPQDVQERRITAEEWYEKHTYHKSVLYTMCLGLKEATGDAALIDLDALPWSNVPKKDIKPSKGQLLLEMKRRSFGAVRRPKGTH